jgi:signal transduction histidine kinase
LDEGLLSSEVYEIFQDSRGFIWFGTDNGVSQFDGYKFVNFQAGKGLTDPVVFGISEDARKRIWFRTFSGNVSYFENEIVKDFKYNHLIEPYCRKSLLQSFYVDESDNVWFGTGENYGKITRDGLLIVDKLKARQIECKSFGANEVVYSYPWPHQFIDAANIDNVNYKIDLSDKINNIQNIPTVKSNGIVWMALGKDIFKLSGRKFTKVYTSSNEIIISLSLDNSGSIWAGFMHAGVVKFNVQDFSQNTTVDFLKDLSVTKVLQDHQGGFWFSTLENGVFHVPDFNVTYFKTPTSSKIKDLVSAGTKSFFGLEDGTVFSMDNHFKMEVIQKPKDPVLALFVDSKKRFWASTNADTHVYDSAGNQILHYPISHNDFYENKSGIYGLSRTRIMKWSTAVDTFKFVYLPYLYRFVSGYDSSFALANRIGLDVFDSKVEKKVFSQLFKKIKVLKVTEINDSLIAVTTRGAGLLVVDKKTFGEKSHFSITQMGENIYSLVREGNRFWVATEKGIGIVPIKNLLDKRPIFKMITSENGLIRNKITHLTFTDPYVIAASEDVFQAIPKSIKLESHPIFYSKKILVNSTEVNQETLKNLKYFQNSVRIEFGFISFTNQNISVRSRLKKEDPWNYGESRALDFYSLAPDHYSLELEYSTDQFKWTPINDGFTIVVNEPWWLNRYFLIVFVAIIVLIVYVVLRNQISALKQRQLYLEANARFREDLLRAEQAAMERERGRISKELHDGVGANLSAMKLLLYNEFRTMSIKSSDFLLNTIDAAIKEIRDIINDLTPHGLEQSGLRMSLEGYLNEIKAKTNFQNIKFHFFGTDPKDIKISITVFRIIQELVSNSLKHARASEISISISYTEGRFNIIYQDNGIGFKNKGNKNGYGLLNIQSRISSVNGTIENETGDLGTSYSINIPVIQ